VTAFERGTEARRPRGLAPRDWPFVARLLAGLGMLLAVALAGMPVLASHAERERAVARRLTERGTADGSSWRDGRVAMDEPIGDGR
jgi:hypothetical protein